jgi:hypothetical protein
MWYRVNISYICVIMHKLTRKFHIYNELGLKSLGLSCAPFCISMESLFLSTILHSHRLRNQQGMNNVLSDVLWQGVELEWKPNTASH